jgi:thiol-disulfide isomerase/thioredoxin
VDAPHLLLNFYSPTCIPCIEELPALHILYQRARERGIPFYIVVEGNPESHGLPSAVTDEEAYRSIRDRLMQDVKRYNIAIPMAVIDGGITVMGGGGLITGTPETIILSTNPLTLRYNFVGPVSSTHNPDEMERDSRFQFILNRLESL